jgi:hypothetical protein
MTVPFWWSVVTQLLTVVVALGVVMLNNRQQRKREHDAWLREKQAQAYERVFRSYNDLMIDPIDSREALRNWTEEILPLANLYLPLEVSKPINALIDLTKSDQPLDRKEARDVVMDHVSEIVVLARKHTGAIAHDRNR